MNAAGALVCGFWDEPSGLAGIGWLLTGKPGGLLLEGDSAAPASATLESGEAATLKLDAGGTRAAAELSPRPGATTLPEPGDGEVAAAPCTAAVSIEGKGPRSLRAEGHLTRWAVDPTDGASLLRHLVLPGNDSALLIVQARRPPGATDQQAERADCWIVDPEGRASRFAETLLSTQYDEAGAPTRISLELWTEDPDAPPMRAGATAAGHTAADGVTAALLRTSVEGTTGLGSYLIWRAG